MQFFYTKGLTDPHPFSNLSMYLDDNPGDITYTGGMSNNIQDIKISKLLIILSAFYRLK